MRIGIITDVLDHHATGIHVYTLELLSRTVAKDTANTYVLIHYKKNSLPLFSYPNVEDVIVPSPRFDQKRTLAKFYQLPKVLRRLKLDIVHDPSQIGVFMRRQPYYAIGNVYDTTFMYYPQYYDWLSKFLNTTVLKRAIRNIDHVVTISESSRQDIHKFFAVPFEKMSVISPAVDHTVFSSEPLTSHQCEQLQTRYALPTNFILYIGALVPHKNVARAIQAFQRVRQQLPDLHFVITGKAIWKENSVFSHLTQADFDNVHFTGFVETEDLPLLYRLARLFVFPSFYEGFGIPVVEAMASGCPVLTSKQAGSLEEVGGQAAHYCDPHSVDSIATGMQLLLTDTAYAHQLISAGLERSKLYNWDTSADQLIDLYKRVTKQS